MTAETESMKVQLCRILYKIGAIKFGTFKLTSGKVSPYYIDLRVVPSFPDAFHKICDIYIQLIREKIGIENFQRVAGIPTAGLAFASVVAYKLDRPFFYTRHDERKHGRERRIEGVLLPGDKALLVDDLITMGKSLLKAASAIRAEGGLVNDAVVLINREEGGEEALATKGITLHYLQKASEVANTLHSVGALTESELKTILKQTKRR